MDIKKNSNSGKPIPKSDFITYTDKIIQKLGNRFKNELLFRAAVIYHLLEKFTDDPNIETKITRYFLIDKDDIKNIKKFHSIRLNNKKYRRYRYFFEQIKAPPKEIIPRKKKLLKVKIPEAIVLTEEEKNHADQIIDCIFKQVGVSSLAELAEILDQSELKSYRTIALLNFTQKYPAIQQNKLPILFEKLGMKENINSHIRRHFDLMHKINNSNNFAIWHRQMYVALSAQIKATIP